MGRGGSSGSNLFVLCAAVSASAAAAAAWWLSRRKLPPVVLDAGPEAKGAVRKRSQSNDVAIPDAEKTLALLRGRRSIFPKDYNGRGRAITDEDVQLLLEGANWAPTHKRTEPWRFVVFRGDARSKVLEATVEGNRAATTEERGGQTFEQWHADFLVEGIEKKWKRCDVMIALNVLRQAHPEKRLPEWEELCAVACAVQNLHLMATSLGLAGYWSSWNIVGRDSKAMAQLLGLDLEAGDRCLGFFVLGCSDAVGKARSGRGPVAEKTRWVGSATPEAGA